MNKPQRIGRFQPSFLPLLVIAVLSLCFVPRGVIAADQSISKTATLEYTGRLLDIQQGYVFFSHGDAYRLTKSPVLQNLDTHRSFDSDDDVTGLYARAAFTAEGAIMRLQITKHVLPDTISSADASRFAIARSRPTTNPELTGAEGMTGKPVIVTFTVQVPPTTNFSDVVYMSTQASHWDPMETRMDRIDALHYRITRSLASGTHYVYRYTRGSWRSTERGRDGLESPPHQYLVRNLDVARRNDTIYHWSDEDPSGSNSSVGPDSIPTPLNGRPFQ